MLLTAEGTSRVLCNKLVAHPLQEFMQQPRDGIFRSLVTVNSCTEMEVALARETL